MNYSQQKDFILEHKKKLIRSNINLFFSILLVSLSIIVGSFIFNFVEVRPFTILASFFLFLFILVKSLELYLNFSTRIYKSTSKKLELLKEQRDTIALNKLS